jgi:hypothetical protein
MGEKEDRFYLEHSVTSYLVATRQFIWSLDRKMAQLYFFVSKLFEIQSALSILESCVSSLVCCICHNLCLYLVLITKKEFILLRLSSQTIFKQSLLIIKQMEGIRG